MQALMRDPFLMYGFGYDSSEDSDFVADEASFQ